jgi:hypothetical protein
MCSIPLVSSIGYGVYVLYQLSHKHVKENSTTCRHHQAKQQQIIVKMLMYFTVKLPSTST